MSLIADNKEKAARIEVLKQCAVALSKTRAEHMLAAGKQHDGWTAWVNSRAKSEGSFIHMCERLDLDPREVRAGMGR